MEFIVLIGIIIIIWVVSKIRDSIENRPSHSFTDSEQRQSTNTHPAYDRQEPTNKTVYRPRTTSTPKTTKIKFKDSSIGITKSPEIDLKKLSGLHDAFTGAPLNPQFGLYQCITCQVFYHKESYQVLVEENSSKCVSCLSTNIVLLTGDKAKKKAGKDYSPNLVTLSNYYQHVGRVITFEGYVPIVRESKRGNDFAVMFENKSWTKGLKLVFFRGAVRKVGGSNYIYRLQGRTVKVRGLLIHHHRYGYEIIVSEKSMILDVR